MLDKAATNDWRLTAVIALIGAKNESLCAALVPTRHSTRTDRGGWQRAVPEWCRDHRDADTLYNLDACVAGFQIRQNHMNGNRRYGCLLRAGGGVVEDNVFEDTTGAGAVLRLAPACPGLAGELQSRWMKVYLEKNLAKP